MIAGWTQELGDPILEQAERILNRRQARRLVIDPDLLGEPGWDILLCAFIAMAKGRVCLVENLERELELSPSVARRWIGRLAARQMIDDNGMTVSITQTAGETVRTLLGAQVDELRSDHAGDDGLLRFSSRN